MSFYSRSFFLTKLGDEFNGIITTISSIIGLLGIAEMGIATSISYKLYEPIFNKDYTRIKEIISILAKYYYKVGISIASIGVLISICIPFYFSSTTFSLPEIYFFYTIFLIISLLAYFFNFSKIMLIADQKNYILQVAVQLTNWLKILSQILLLVYYNSFFGWIIIELLYALLFSVTLQIIIKKQYPWLFPINKNLEINSDIQEEVKEKTKQVFIHRISSFMLTSTDTIFIGLFSSVQMVTFFTNYNIIFTSISMLISNVFSNITSSIGNLLIENNKQKSLAVFFEIQALNYFISLLIVFPLFFSINDFILIWLSDSKYILSNTTLLLMLLNINHYKYLFLLLPLYLNLK